MTENQLKVQFLPTNNDKESTPRKNSFFKPGVIAGSPR